MGKLIKLRGKEGDFFLRWLDSRMIRQNKNVLGVELGGTGSGKSYRDLRKAELWYDYHFKEKFPVENICFGVLSVMERISSGELRKGEVIIFEEAGANLGNLDFQNRMSKMFTYVLQSFRSMNIAIFFNLPYLSMLNKSARMLMHYSFESNGVDYKNNTNSCRPFFHQVNQKTGKIYPKFPKITHKGKVGKIKEFTFSIPSKYLIDAYEKKKEDYLSESTKEYTDKMREIEQKEKPKPVEVVEKKDLNEIQQAVYDLYVEGLNEKEIAVKLGKSPAAVYENLKTIRKRGHLVEKS